MAHKVDMWREIEFLAFIISLGVIALVMALYIINVPSPNGTSSDQPSSQQSMRP
jgi:hypothetical protein